MISIDFFYYYLFSFTFVGLEQRVEKKTTTRTVVDTILNRLKFSFLIDKYKDLRIILLRYFFRFMLIVTHFRFNNMKRIAAKERKTNTVRQRRRKNKVNRLSFFVIFLF